MKLEKMDAFFIARLNGYDDLGCGIGLELEYYFSKLERLKSEQGLEPTAFYHYDTPLTVEHEMEVLKEAGFSDVRMMRNWKSIYTIFAR